MSNLKNLSLQSTAMQIALRLILFLVFLALLYGFEYDRVRDAGFVYGGELESRLFATIRAANAGYPFRFYFAEELAPASVDPDYLYTWESVSDDYGVMFLTSATSAVGRVLSGDDFLIGVETPFRAVFGLFALTALLILFSDLPLPIAGAGVAALAFAIFFGPLGLSVNARTWGAAYMVILLGIMGAFAVIPGTRWRLPSLLGISILIGIAMIIRQEGSGIAALVGASLLAGSWFSGGVAYWTTRHDEQGRKSALRFAMRASIPAVMILFAFIATPYIVRFIYSQAWDKPYSETYTAQHGAGLPLYAGLGYVSNPYNINWMDVTTVMHAHLYEPEAEFQLGDETHQEIMTRSLKEVLTKTPWLLPQNIIQKGRFVHQFLFFGETPFPTAFNYSAQPAQMRVVYVLFLIGLGVFAVLIFRWREPLPLLSFGVGVIIAAASLVGAFSGFPSYISGIQGATIAVVFLQLPLLVYLHQHRDAWGAFAPEAVNTITLSMLRWGSLTLGAAALLIFAILAVFWTRHQNQLDDIAAGDPLAQIQEMEFRYTALFNDLSPEEKSKIMATLQEQDDPRILLPVTPADDSAYFRPVVAVFSETQLHIIVWLGDGFSPPDEAFHQPRVHSIIQVCSDCDTLLQAYRYDPESVTYAFVNDTDWQNSYRMFSFPIHPDAFQDGFRIGAQRLVNWGGDATFFGYQVEDLYQYTFQAAS